LLIYWLNFKGKVRVRGDSNVFDSKNWNVRENAKIEDFGEKEDGERKTD